MRRFLLVLVMFGAAILFLRRLAGVLGATRAGRQDSGANRGRSGVTELVRDRVCNTFLPRSKALEVTAAGETHFFCSSECRSRFLAGPSSQADIARHA